MNARTRQVSDQHLDGDTFFMLINHIPSFRFERIGAVEQIFYFWVTNPIRSKLELGANSENHQNHDHLHRRQKVNLQQTKKKLSNLGAS